MQQPEWIEDATGKITGYKTLGGADTVFPFKNLPEKFIITATGQGGTTSYVGATIPNPGYSEVVFSGNGRINTLKFYDKSGNEVTPVSSGGIYDVSDVAKIDFYASYSNGNLSTYINVTATFQNPI